MSKFLSQKFSNLVPYVPGEQPKDKEYVKLNTNESPFPPSKNAIRLAKKSAKRLKLYPDPDCKVLTKLVADDLGVESKNVILTNGSDEVLNFAFMAYCDADNPAIFPDITYGFYKVFADINSVPYEMISLKEDFSIDLSEYATKNGTIFIANPNAPTGIFIPVSKIEELLLSNKERVVVIDEAYVDFGNESCVSLINKYDNLLVTRTFSKSRSMAGARLGFGVANENIINDLMSIKYSTNPYNVNMMTASAGEGSIKDNSYFIKNCKNIISNREWTTNELLSLGFYATNSTANFIFAKSDKIDGKDLYLKLKENGILVRHFSNERISDYIRVTVGSKKEMEKFISAVKNILENL